MTSRRSERSVFSRRALARRTDRRHFLRALGAASLLAPSWLPARARAADPEPIAPTAYGRVRGTTQRGVHVFRGIPYGAPTGGRNRVLPPRPPTPWTDVRDTLDYGPSSPQRDPAHAEAGRRSPAAALIGDLSDRPESEDCLALNVWTPGLGDGGKRPVLFWCHGGGFSAGSGSSPGYDGTNLCVRGDVVVVTVNHRLNVLGYTHLADLLGEEFEHSGNAGLLDLVLALQWVRDHIEHFGGDPGRVLLFGESGGGRKVSALLAMPAARGLFSRAAIQSGPGVRMAERADASMVAELLLDELGIPRERARKLLDTPLDRLLIAYHQVARKRAAPGPDPHNVIRSFAPVVGGAVLPGHPFDPHAPALSHDVPLIIGSNRTEMTLFALGDPTAFALDDDGLHERARGLVGDQHAGAAIETYRHANPGASPAEIYFLLSSDYQYRAHTIAIAERKAAAGGAPVYLYQFAWRTPVMDGKLLTPHALEIPFVFDHAADSRFTGGGAKAAALADRMSDAWIAVARSGDPNVAKLPPWPPSDPARRATMVFDDTCAVIDDFRGAERRAMAEYLGLAAAATP